ncbi:hypothetical protein NFI95_13400 [Acetobacteraceae bacterium KSS8]|uniref:Bacterial transcriptional activator domain-containing protein n=1 Tax=Endosaccharibacter trunci TaxID=2812733 RepID=A0ABT1WBE2_9PROT|nr:hypothetical protein [Acetobacteraceae bacterium KSS8]
MRTAIDRLRDADAPPPDATPALRALWHEVHGDWHAAHALVEEPADTEECLLHAFLHRAEGDLANASYWYRRAQVPLRRDSLDAERAALAERLLG